MLATSRHLEETVRGCPCLGRKCARVGNLQSLSATGVSSSMTVNYYHPTGRRHSVHASVPPAVLGPTRSKPDHFSQLAQSKTSHPHYLHNCSNTRLEMHYTARHFVREAMKFPTVPECRSSRHVSASRVKYACGFKTSLLKQGTEPTVRLSLHPGRMVCFSLWPSWAQQQQHLHTTVCALTGLVSCQCSFDTLVELPRHKHNT